VLAQTAPESGRERYAGKGAAPQSIKPLSISSEHIVVTTAVFVISTCAAGEEEGAKSGGAAFVLSSSQEEHAAWKWNFTNSNFVTSD
jgi:hypothetical protein